MSNQKKYSKNDEFDVVITDIGANGEGIGHLNDGYTLFVQGAVPGDCVTAHIIKAQKNYGIARVQKLVTASPHRIEPMCPVAGRCGGCQLANLSYDAQLRIKENKVKELLVRVGGVEKKELDAVFHPIVGCDENISSKNTTPCRFRNKAQYPVGYDNNGKLVAGFYSNHSHRIVPNNDCLIGAETDRDILDCILEYMEEYHITAYDELEHKGLVRHILIRTGYLSGEIMVCLVVNGTGIPEKEELINRLSCLEFPECAGITRRITSICLSSNTARTNVIMGDSFKVIWGNGYINDKIGELQFRISPLSFFQVNAVQTVKLYNLALEAAGLTGNEVVWDLYCGTGTISLFLAKQAKSVYGVEIIPAAIENAKENAQNNNINNASFYVGKAEEVLPDFYKNADPGNQALTPDVIVVDPPRKGCEAECLNTMLQMKPERIVYVSCDPATLARDMKRLCEDGGYICRSVTPVDMFPNSGHVETVCLLSKLYARDVNL